jgi:TP901 family phage tail tape measure protein
MADIESNINLNIDTTEALASIRALQSQISAFHRTLAKGGASANVQSAQMQQNLINTINKTGAFSASMTKVASTTEAFTQALEQNKLTMGQTFRHSMATTKTFGRFFRSEFDTITKTARERVKDLQTQYIRLGRDGQGAMNAIKVRPLALDMQNFGTQTAIAAQKQQILNQLIRTGSTNLLNWGKNTQWAGRQLMVGFTIPLAMMGAAASKSFMDIEREIIKIQRVYGDFTTSVEETDKMVSSLRQLAGEFTKYGVAVKDTLALAGDFAAAGNEGVALLNQVREASRLAVLGNVSQQEAFDATISLTNAFGIAASDLASKIDFLNAVENQSVLSIEDLTIAIPKAAPVVRQLGGDIEDLAFFLTAMKEGGINASQGANALKSGLASMINPAEKTVEFLKQLGINITGIVEGNAGDIKGTVIGLANALNELDPLNRARAIEQLFGKFQFSRISALFQNVIDEGSQANRVLKLTNATSAELAILSERELKRVENSTTFKFEKAIENFTSALAPVGEEFLKAITPIIEFGTKLLKKFNGMGDGVKQFAVIAVAAIGGIGPILLMVIGLIANAAANMIKFVSLIRGRFQNTAGEVGVLGNQTEYLTQSQIRAMSAAASLQQSHNTLTQQFTSEIATIQNLIGAYNQAIIAQNRFAAAGASASVAKALTITTNSRGGRRVIAPQGYASGVLSVPGPRGAGDVVPAMLSPGEAVIPARQAQKYSGFISSMIADNVPGFRFGRNPFAAMLGRSQVAVRMKDSDFSSALAAGGRNARYKSAFETGTGADYLNRSGSVNERQKLARSSMERDLFGLDPKSTLASARPTYGYAKTPILSSLMNRLFGLKGKNFNAVTAGNRTNSMERYGNIDLITKGSVAKRSSAYPGDSLMSYVRARESQGRRPPNWAASPYAPINMNFAPMRGASGKNLGDVSDKFGQPFGQRKVPGTTGTYTTNGKPPYIETQTPGGFAFSEIDKIIARDPVIAKRLKAELRQAGLGSVRVTGSNFVARLFRHLGVPGYSQGSQSIESSSVISKIANDLEQRTDLDFKAKQRLRDYFSATDRSRRTVPQSLEILSKSPPPGYGKDILTRLGVLGVGNKDTMKIMSALADFAPKGEAKLQAARSTLLSELESAPKTASGLIKKSDILTRRFRSITGWRPNNAGAKAFSHIGSGAKLTASEILALNESGQLNLKPGEKKVLESFVKNNPGYRLDLKTGLGMSGIPQSLNAKLDKATASKSEMLSGFKQAGISKWEASVRFGGGKFAALDAEVRRFDSEFEKIISSQSDDTIFTDTEEKAQELRRQNKKAISLTSIYSTARSRLQGSSSSLFKVLDGAHSSATEVRASGNEVDKVVAQSGVKKNPFVSPAAGRNLKSVAPLAVLRSMSLQELFSGRRGFRFASGVVSVPGPKGAGDVVPAMLSPGEAVIPTEMASKYSSLIGAMISGNVPGYNGGTPKVPGIPNNTQSATYTGILGPPPGPAGIAVPGIPANNSPLEISVAPNENKWSSMFSKATNGIQKGVAVGLEKGAGLLTTGLSKLENSSLAPKIVETLTGQGPAADARKAQAQQIMSERHQLANAALQQDPAYLQLVEQEKIIKAQRQENANRGRMPTSFEDAEFSNKVLGPKVEMERRAFASFGGPMSANPSQKELDIETQKSATLAAQGGSTKLADTFSKDIMRDPDGNVVVGADGAPVSKKEARRAARQERSAGRKKGFDAAVGRAGGALMGLTMVAGMAAAVPGVVGETAQKVMLPLGAAATAMTMFPGKIGLIVAAFAALGAVAYGFKEELDKARKAARESAAATSAGSKAMENFAAAAGTTTATSVMNRVRQEEMAPFQVVTGKNTFGNQFLQSEQGQTLLNEAKNSKMTGSSEDTADKIGLQLSQAIASNILTKDQAFSIAMGLGEAMGDYDFAVDVNGRMVELLGPGGEDLLNDPLAVKILLVEEKSNELDKKGGAREIIDSTDNTFGDIYAKNPSGLMNIVLRGRTNATEVAGAEAEAAQVIQDIMNMSAENLNALELEHNKNIENLRKSGDVEAIAAAEQKYLEDRKELLDASAAALKEETDWLRELEAKGGVFADSAQAILLNVAQDKFDSFEGQDEDIKKANITAVKNISDNPNLDYADKITLTAMINVDNIGLFKQLQETFPVNENIEFWTKIAKIGTELGPGTSMQMLNLLSNFSDDDKAGKFVDYTYNLQATGKPEDMVKAQAAIDTMEMLTKIADMGVEIDLADYVTNEGVPTEIFERISSRIQKVNKLFDDSNGQQLEYGVNFTSMGFNLTAAQAEWFNDLPAYAQKVFALNYTTMLDTITPEQIAAKRQQLRGTEGSEVNRISDQAIREMILHDESFKRAEEAQPIGFDQPLDDPDDGDGGGSGRTSAFLDDIVKKIRDLRDETVKLPKSLEEAMASITKFAKTGIVGFEGLADAIRKAGGDTELVNIALSATEEELEKIFSNGSLTDFGRDLETSLRRISLGEFLESQRASLSNTQKQIAAFQKLRDAGVSVVNAQKMIQSQDLVDGLAAAGVSAAEAQKVIDSWIRAQQESKKILTEAERIIEEEGLNAGVLGAEIGVLQAGLNVIQLQEDDINKKYNDRLEALDKVRDANEEITRQQKSQLTLADALSKGDIAAAARAMQESKEQSARSAMEQQRSAIEQARRKESDSLQAKINGTLLNREEIEERIAGFQKQIAQLELDKIRPAQLDEAIGERDAYQEIVTAPPPPPPPPPPPAPAAPANRGTYTVVRGDTLSGISKKYYGDANQWRKIYDANKGVIGSNPNMIFPGQVYTIPLAMGGMVPTQKYAMGGKVGYFPMGGMIPYKAMGGMFKTVNTDSVPAMLSPGEFVIRRSAVERFGEANLQKINSGLADTSSSVYNYSVNVSVKSDANPDQIAQSVIKQIKQIDSQRIRGNRF